jgi:hypothetical protein
MSLLMQNDSQPELSSSFNSLVVFLLTDLGFLVQVSIKKTNVTGMF